MKGRRHPGEAGDDVGVAAEGELGVEGVQVEEVDCAGPGACCYCGGVRGETYLFSR